MIAFFISGTCYLLLTIIRNRILCKKSQSTKEYLFVIIIIAVIFVASTHLVVPCLRGEYQLRKHRADLNY